MVSYRVVYKGEVLPGFDVSAVRQSAAERLKASPAQIDALFSGRGAVLKKGLDAQSGERYIALLQRLGMLAHLEAEPAAVAPPAAVTPPPARTDFDAERTLVADPRIVAAFAQGGAAPYDIGEPQVPAPLLRAVPGPSPAVIVRRDPAVRTEEPARAPANGLRAAEPTLLVRRDGAPVEALRPVAPPAEPTSILRREAVLPPAVEPTPVARPGTQARIICPRCGLEQPRRLICERCGHDMTRPADVDTSVGPETVFVDPNRGAANDAPVLRPVPQPIGNPHWIIVLAALAVAAAAAVWFFVFH